MTPEPPRDRVPRARGPVPLSGPRFQTDPPQLYREMRRDHGSVAPVVLDGDIPAWLVLGYRELHQVTSDPVLFSRDSDLWNQWDAHPRRLAAAADDRPQAAVDPLHGRRAAHRPRVAMISNALEAVDPFELKRYAEEFADELIDGFCATGRDRHHRRVRDAAARPASWPGSTASATRSGARLVGALNDMIDGRSGPLAGQQHLGDAMFQLLADKHAEPGDDVATRMLRRTPAASPTRRSPRT